MIRKIIITIPIGLILILWIVTHFRALSITMSLGVIHIGAEANYGNLLLKIPRSFLTQWYPPEYDFAILRYVSKEDIGTYAENGPVFRTILGSHSIQTNSRNADPFARVHYFHLQVPILLIVLAGGVAILIFRIIRSKRRIR